MDARQNFSDDQAESFTEVTDKVGSTGTNGWWSSHFADDIDGNGDIDLLAGNAGLNLQIKAHLLRRFPSTRRISITMQAWSRCYATIFREKVIHCLREMNFLNRFHHSGNVLPVMHFTRMLPSMNLSAPKN